MPLRHADLYARGLRTSIRDNAAAYGYSVVITVCVAALDSLVPPVTIRRLALVVFGAAAAFTTLEAVVTGFFRQRVRGERSDVVMLGSAMNFMSMGAALAAAAAIASLWESWVAWLVAPFVATLVYLLVVGIELALARRGEEKVEKS